MAVGETYPAPAAVPGKIEKVDILDEYVKHILTYVDVSKLKPYKIVVNTGNGAAGPIINAMEKFLPFELVKVYNEPDGNFPNGVPNPILQENREATAKVVRETGADFGVAWDGDFDRCFLFDEKGGFIEGYYMVGFLSEAFLKKNKGRERHLRSAPCLEHDRDCRGARRHARHVQERARIHQGQDA